MHYCDRKLQESQFVNTSTHPLSAAFQVAGVCWSLSQLALWVGRVTDWISQQFTARPCRKTNNRSHGDSHSLHAIWSSPHVHVFRQQEEAEVDHIQTPRRSRHRLDSMTLTFTSSCFVIFCTVMVIGAFLKALHSPIYTHWFVAAARPTGGALGCSVLSEGVLTCGQSRPEFKPHRRPGLPALGHIECNWT